MDNKVEVKVETFQILKEYFYSADVKFIYFLMILMVVDILTGFAKAIKNKDLWKLRNRRKRILRVKKPQDC